MLREQQLLFANHLRNPARFPAPTDVEERRMRIYRQLFFGNISQLLANTFPVIHSILSDEQWQALVRDFYAGHRSETPLFPFIAGEFAAYLQNERDVESDYPFIAELAQYEWCEIALRHSEAELPAVSDAAPIEYIKPALSPLCWPMVFRFPVHRIGSNYLPDSVPATSTYLLVYRNRDEQIKFIESSAATFRVLQLLADETLSSVRAVSEVLAIEMQHPDPAALFEMLSESLRQLLQANVLYVAR